MKLLIVEDNMETIKGIQDYASDKGWSCECCDFAEASDSILKYQPEIIVLDWMYDIEDVEKGKEIFEEMYRNAFRPVIIFSALASAIELPTNMQNNPLVNFIMKGDEEKVIKKIEEWHPYIEAVSSLRKEFNESLLVSVEAIDNFMKMPEYPGDEVVKYMLNKRTTYYFDKEYIGTEPPAWIQYEYPPILNHLIVADVIRCIVGTEPAEKVGMCEEYFIMLTPSCDLTHAKTTDKVLLANCEAKEKFHEKCNLKKGEELGGEGFVVKKDMLIRSLNQGYNYAKVPLPELPNKIPYVTINLKKIRQVDINEIAFDEKNIKEHHKYYRVASVNSPYREQIVWAHMINSCRPGLPDRNMNNWADGIMGS